MLGWLMKDEVNCKKQLVNTTIDGYKLNYAHIVFDIPSIIVLVDRALFK